MSAEAQMGWPASLHAVLRRREVRQVAYVPDGGHAELIRLVQADDSMTSIVLTTEEEGVALLAGAWLGGERGVLLMQSSGVGNCINMLSLIRVCRFPFLTLVTMRGEWGEFNPWQTPMGSSTLAALNLMDVRVVRADTESELAETVDAAAVMAFDGGGSMAVLLGQRLIGSKVFTK